MNEDFNYYLEQLHQQTSFLVDACTSYDKGNFAQAKMLSHIMRTIIKDPKDPKRKSNTISLLTHLQDKKIMKFYNTGFEIKNAKMNINLVGFVSVPSKLQTHTKQVDNIFLPLLNFSSQIDLRWLTFEQWWESKIIVMESENFKSIFTRERIVLTMAEQDGGSHVDAKQKVDKEYLELATAAKSYFHHVDPSGNEYPIIYMHYALVRQIAHELILTLIKKFNFSLEYKPTNEHNLRGIPKENIIQPGFLVESDKIESTRTKFPYKISKSEAFTTPPNAAYIKFFY